MASGEGSGFEALVQASRQGDLAAEVCGLIVNRSQAPALTRAQRLQIPAAVLPPQSYSDRDLWDQAVLSQLQAWQSEWVVLAGFLTLVGPRVLANFAGRVVNSHPALLPKFGGAGMFGARVHKAVLQAAEPVTGVTIHLVDEEYDRGKILHQAQIQVEKHDTADSLARRVKALEHRIYPSVLNDLVSGRLKTR